MSDPEHPRPRRRGARARGAEAPKREVNYRTLNNPFPVMKAFSDDRIEAIHEAALSVLEDDGILVLLPEARAIYRAAGAQVDEGTHIVRIGREIVAGALATAPRSITLRGAVPERDVLLELGRLVFQPGGGAPHATDLARGRRPGLGRDFRELVQISQHFDAFQMISSLVEPQDIEPHLRHYFTIEAKLTLSDKAPFVYARGTPQALDSFEMLRDFRGLSDDAFRAEPWSYTIINTNSPRALDIPMAQGLIDFARNGQMCIVTPFTLMGAMAPITVAGAMVLSHAEALAAITLTQLARPGAPVLYGTFTSNVDMKSGSPAFGTPEQFTASLAAGQLARLIGLPFRNASGSAANIADAQAANENQFALWGTLLSGTTVIIHAAGWLEGGLSLSYEKLITDMEVLQMVAELCTPTPAETPDLARDAIAEIGAGGHFFGCDHTMARYQTQFYSPLVADWSNFGRWQDQGGFTASERATGVWQGILAADNRPATDPGRVEALHDFIARRSAEGGAPPES
ncbi:trimethylamine methyltransferase family protein [Maritimibacter sp. HL-12]|uniref:trimethylamine methyltransferase family protein n=1 Tax=Maritimibacter sp. HL-12 TaxID=1162418 RepID=UPI000A0F0BEE|nr:trimethylamine methyltransferase family protein [Maritimibacter sp. HL-12]SMH53413.1 trimethylamine---corrinoid protein Co-methyltransferase [Maritimibacter sp. HL-12]